MYAMLDSHSPAVRKRDRGYRGCLGRGDYAKHTSYDLVYFIRGRRDHMQVPELLIQALPVPIQFHIFPGCTAGKIKSMQKTPRRGVVGWVG